MRLHHLFLAAGLMSSAAHANVCGTDYQIFNPTTNGLDFVTVQSSETLSPCVINSGLFFNYAANSLTYSKTLNTNFPSGQKRNDRTLGMDVSLGTGITKRWDVGINIPFVLNQEVKDDYYVSSIGHDGATEVKINTKFKFVGDDSWGVAGVFSINKNLLRDNPFAGDGAGPTYNYELAADATIAGKWAIGANFGYRDRNPGTQLYGVPFVPMGDQWIYSAAASYLVASLDTKVIMEVYGSKAAQKVAQDTDRNLNSLEGLLGFKHDLSPGLALHFGGAHQIGSSIGGADWRLYAGVNWAIGPLCKTEPVIVTTPSPQPAAPQAAAPAEPEIITLNLQFAWNSDQVDPKQLEELAPRLQEYFTAATTKVSVEGHTDSVGDPDYNIDLSARRAKTVHDFLSSRYNIVGKSEAKGFGSSTPIADNGNYQGRRQNRRVEIKVWRNR